MCRLRFRIRTLMVTVAVAAVIATAIVWVREWPHVEYSGDALSGKYMFDDAQYFPPGPDFPWANTQAAMHRARMRAMGLELDSMPNGPDAFAK